MSLLRPIEPRDHARVLELNDNDVDLLAPLDQERLEQLLRWTASADVIEAPDEAGANQVAGFVLTFAPGTAYDSENYRWFSESFEDFLYLDRIVLDPGFRRRGLGGRVYDELEERARKNGRMVLEVNVEPPNDGSLAFHRGRGYADLTVLGDGRKKVLLMEKILTN